MSRTISVLTAPELANVETKSLLGKSPEAVWQDVDFDKLKANLEKMTQDLGELFDSAEKPSGYALKQITVGLEISAEGGVKLIGTLNAGAKAAISLTFERAS